MASLGMTALGAFIGSIISMGIRQTKDWSDLQKLLTTLISAALAGGVFTFIEFLGGQKLGSALFLYPVGLTLGLVWVYSDVALANVQSQNGSARSLGWLHLLGMTLLSLFVLVLLFSPQFRSLLPQ